MSQLFTDFHEFEMKVLNLIDAREDLRPIKKNIITALYSCFCVSTPEKAIHDDAKRNTNFKKLIIDETNKIAFDGIHLPHRLAWSVNYTFVVEQEYPSKIGNMKYVVITADCADNKIYATYSSDDDILLDLGDS
jgi:hypothetical protein